MGDAATIISIVPYPIYETKSGVFPSYFRIEAAGKDEVKTLVVKDAIAWQYIDERRGSLKIDVPARQLADDIVNSYCRNIQGYLEDASPGLIAIDGEVSLALVLTNHKDALKKLRLRQENWFKNLVAIADDVWAETHQYKHIDLFQRLAATRLGLTKEWNVLPSEESTKACPWCLSVIPSAARVCRFCQRDTDGSTGRSPATPIAPVVPQSPVVSQPTKQLIFTPAASIAPVAPKPSDKALLDDLEKSEK